jgi:hypothetical protein
MVCLGMPLGRMELRIAGLCFSGNIKMRSWRGAVRMSGDRELFLYCAEVPSVWNCFGGEGGLIVAEALRNSL